MQFASAGDYNSSSQVSNKPLSNLAKLYEAGHFYNLPSLSLPLNSDVSSIL